MPGWAGGFNLGNGGAAQNIMNDPSLRCTQTPSAATYGPDSLTHPCAGWYLYSSNGRRADRGLAYPKVIGDPL